MFGNQRPAAPWSFHSWWGQYDTPSDLPNVSGAKLQLPDVQQGDMAWSRSDQQLYVCVDSTVGAAIWQGMLSLLPSSQPEQIYVAPNSASASDDGPGTVAEPLATLDEAIRRMNRIRIPTATVLTHLASGNYQWNEQLGPLPGPAALGIVCDGAGQSGDDGFTEVQSAEAAAAGTGQRVVVDPNGGLTTNVWQGFSIEILSGAAAGDRRNIATNTATNIIPNAAFSAAVAPGDSFRIVRPAAIVVFPGAAVGSGGSVQNVVGCGDGVIQGRSTFGLQRTAQTALLLSNLSLRPPAGSQFASFQIARSGVLCAGVEVVGTGLTGVNVVSDTMSAVCGGYDENEGFVGFVRFELPATLGLAASPTQWLGWGLSLFDVNTPWMSNFSGYLVIKNSSAIVTMGDRGFWEVLGGAMNLTGTVGGSNAAFQTGGNANVGLNGIDSALPILLTATGAAIDSMGLASTRNASMEVRNTTLTLSGNGVGIVAGAEHQLGVGQPRLPGRLALANGVTISAPRVALGVTGGGFAMYDDPPTLPVAPSVAEAAVFQGSVGNAPTSSSTFAALADGASIVNATTPGDGSVIMRVT